MSSVITRAAAETVRPSTLAAMEERRERAAVYLLLGPSEA
jgi:hypothetical protein